MSKLDERLRAELRRAAPEPQTQALFDGLAERHRRRRVARKIGTVALAVVVLAGTAVGFVALDRAFRGGPRPASGTPTNGSVIGVVRDSMRTSHLVLYPADGSASVNLTPPGLGTDADPAASPDGRFVAFAHAPVSIDDSPSTLRLLDLTTGETRDLMSGEIHDPSWSSDGAEILTAGMIIPSLQRYDALFAVAADGRTPPRQLPLDYAGTSLATAHPTWSPDGAGFAFENRTREGGGPGVFVADAETGAWDGTKIVSTNGDTPALPSWSPDGSWVAVVGDSIVGSGDPTHDIVLVSPQSSETRSAYGDVPVDQRPTVDSLGWSPDGTALVYSAADGKIYTMAIGGSPIEIGSGDEPTWLPAVDFTIQPQPEPSTTTTPEAGIDIGLNFRLCHVESMGGVDLLGDGTDGTVWTGARVAEDGTCPDAYDTPYVEALDHTGDGIADEFDRYSIPNCQGCRPFGTTDLNGDGHQELVLLLQGGSELQYLLMVADIREGGVWFGPVFVTDPGDPDWGFAPGRPFTFWAGGDENRSEAVECVDEAGSTTLLLTQGRGSPTYEAGQPTTIHETRLQLSAGGSHIFVVGVNEQSIPAGAPIPPTNQGPTCGGLDFNPWQ